MSNQLSLEAVLRDLMQRRIFCGISTKAPDHVLVWLVFNGRLVEGTARHRLAQPSFCSIRSRLLLASPRRLPEGIEPADTC